MVHFNELQVTSNGKNIIIDVSVPNIKGYEDVTIESIAIDTLDTFKEGSKPLSPVITIPANNLKQFRVDVSTSSIGGANNLFFIWVKNTSPSIEAECGTDTLYTIGVTLNKCPIYNSIMLSLRELNNSCSIPKDFIDGYLKYKAIELSIETCHYDLAILYYKEFYSNIKLIETKSCGCYG